MSGQRRRVDLIHVGYHKCASTTLQAHMFSNHPHVAYTRDAKCVLDAAYDLDRAVWHEPAGGTANLYVVSSEGLCGVDYERLQPNPEFLKLPDVLHAVRPDAKVLMMIRRQADIIKSYYAQSIIKFANVAPLEAFYRDSFAGGCFQFDVPIEKYQSNYGTDRVLVLPLEELKSDRRSFLARLSDFTGVDFNSLQLPVTNFGASRLGNEVMRFLNYAFRRLGDQRPWSTQKKRLRRLIDHAFAAVGADKRLPYYTPERLEEVRAFYRESNQRTSDLIGVDLVGRYGY